jgi:hypothetical protein
MLNTNDSLQVTCIVVLVSFEREAEPQTESQTEPQTGPATANPAAIGVATTVSNASTSKCDAPPVYRAVVHKQLVAVRDDATRETIVYRLVRQIDPVTPHITGYYCYYR